MREHDEGMIERIISELRRPESLDPAVDARVMAAVRRERIRRGRLSPWEWLTRPRIVSVSPLGGLAVGGALAAVLALAVVGPMTDGGVPGGQGPGSEAAPVTATSIQTVQFVLAAPRASRVALVGDFNDWDRNATQLHMSGGGLWTVTVPLRAGRYTYTFVVDGEQWVADPSAPPAASDDFGRPSSVVTVSGAQP